MPSFPQMTFYRLCLIFNIDLWQLASDTELPKDVIDHVFLGDPISRSEAEKILKTISLQTKNNWTLDNVKIHLKGE